jgi:hypothetical protein
MRLLPALVFVLAVAGGASASPWTAPDSTRPAPWGGRAPAPAIAIPMQILQPPPPIAQIPLEPGGAPPADPGYSDPYVPWTYNDDGDGGGSGPGGGPGCGGTDAGSSDSCGPSGDF